MKRQVVALGKPADSEFLVAEDGGFLHPGTVPDCKQGALAGIARLGDAAEEELHVPLEPIWQLTVGEAFSEMCQSEVDEQVFLAADCRGFEFLRVEEAAHPLVYPAPGAYQSDQRLGFGALFRRRRPAEVQGFQPVGVDLLAVVFDQCRYGLVIGVSPEKPPLAADLLAGEKE